MSRLDCETSVSDNTRPPVATKRRLDSAELDGGRGQPASPAARRRPETQNSRCVGSRRPSAGGGIRGDPIDRKWSRIPRASSSRSMWA